jgi:hypothetical protein
VEVSWRIQLTQSKWKPKARRMFLIYFQLIVSKDFEKSSLISIPGVREDLSECITSWARMTLSRIFYLQHNLISLLK